MQVALIGLAQSGKSELFKAVTQGKAHSNTGVSHQIDKAIVKVPDERLAVLTQMYKPKKTTHATIEFLDLPGLSFTDEGQKQESRRIIAQARQADMLVLVVRGFENDSVAKYKDRIDPAADVEEARSELLMADLELVANRMEKLEKSVTKPSPRVEMEKRELVLMKRCYETIENLEPLSKAIDNEEEEKIVRSFGFLTLKPLLVVLNVDEDKVNTPSFVSSEDAGGEVMVLAATLEAELAALEEDERGVFMEDMGISTIARDRLVKACYSEVKLISFLTAGEDEVRAWSIPRDCPAVEAAGAIHSDIQRGFIRAETVAYDDLIAGGDMKGAKAAGKVRLEGKSYEVQDGDIINFRFNV